MEMRIPAANGFGSAGLACKPRALGFSSSVVLVDPACAGIRNPPERKARKRWQQA